ncbi:hypothetical protein [Methylobacterium sp. Leaf106]|uniref:hypothetical protein n=1 Tax=Methylobacterium sp. Leaf106 TaxID=1736255 RepID=UPI0006FA2263|nr:hypothetical protein [Methylobacterium sp. Leaf106]KQP53007.1 hypothetical protein ASF34_01145 [Methylobacterium sp. Leaf106]
MCRIILTIATLLALTGVVSAQSFYNGWQQPDGTPILGNVIYCATGKAREALPCGGPTTPLTVLSTPFSFANGGDPIIFAGITTTPKQFQVDKPASVTSYRIINPCNVDIRARRVADLTQQVTPTTGVRVMARSAETFGTSSPGFVSIMALAAPSADCNLELNYGNGG